MDEKKKADDVIQSHISCDAFSQQKLKNTTTNRTYQ